MGCGKSAVAALFEREGFRRLDSDALVRERVLTSPDVVARIEEKFGLDVLTPEGAVNRARLAERIFGDEADRQWLEELTHPRLYELWREALAAAPGVNWAVEVPLLFEKCLENWFDFTVCVACAPAQQLARLEQRGLPHALAEQRISKQLPLTRKIELADFVLWNEGTAQFLQDQVDHLIPALTVAR